MCGACFSNVRGKFPRHVWNRILSKHFADKKIKEPGHLFRAGGVVCRYLLNILLDPVFVMPWGLGMGGEGAGLAELCGLRLFCCADVRAEKAHLYFAVSQKPLYEKSIVYGVCGVGIPAVIHNLLNVTGMMVLNNFTALQRLRFLFKSACWLTVSARRCSDRERNEQAAALRQARTGSPGETIFTGTNSADRKVDGDFCWAAVFFRGRNSKFAAASRDVFGYVI